MVLLPCLSLSQTFLPFGSYEYYIERNNPVWSYSEAERKCNARNTTLAVVNRKDIRNHIVVEIGNLTGKTTKEAISPDNNNIFELVAPNMLKGESGSFVLPHVYIYIAFLRVSTEATHLRDSNLRLWI